jgi:hypothetical protein
MTPLESNVALFTDTDTRANSGPFPLIVAELYDNDGKVVSQVQRGTIVANKVHTHEYLILSAARCLPCCLLPAG